MHYDLRAEIRRPSKPLFDEMQAFLPILARACFMHPSELAQAWMLDRTACANAPDFR